MSVFIAAKAWQVSGLSFAEKLVLLKLADMANDEGVCWPSNAKIGAHCGLDQRSVRRIVARLEAAKLVQRRERFAAKGVQTSNWLVVLAPADRSSVVLDDMAGAPGPASPTRTGGSSSTRTGGSSSTRTGRSSLGRTGGSSKPSVEPSLKHQSAEPSPALKAAGTVSAVEPSAAERLAAKIAKAVTVSEIGLPVLDPVTGEPVSARKWPDRLADLLAEGRKEELL